MKRIICIILTVLLLIGATACSFNATTQNKDTSNVMYDFEDGIFGVRMEDSFGSVVLNNDEKYTTSGKQSIKLMPINKSKTPTVFFPFKSDFKEQDYSNIRKVVSVSVNVYTETPTTIGMGWYFSTRAESRGLTEVYSLHQGWNTVTYNNDISIVAIQYDLSSFKGVFLNYQESDNLPVMYVDDITVELTDNDQNYIDLVNFDITNDVFGICDFEYSYQNFVFSVASTYRPTTEIVGVGEDGVHPSSGNKMLKIVPMPTTVLSYTHIQLSNVFFNSIDWKYFSEHYEEYVFKYDLYQVGSQGFDNYFNVFAYYNDKYSYTEFGRTRDKDKWVTVTVPLKDMLKFLENPISFAFLYPNNADENRVIYLDNIRFEKVK